MSAPPPTDSALESAFSTLPGIDVDVMAAQAADLALRLGVDAVELRSPGEKGTVGVKEMSAKDRKKAAWREKQRLWAQGQGGSKKAPLPRPSVKLPVAAQEKAGGVLLTSFGEHSDVVPPPGAEVLSSVEIEEINTITSTLSDTVSDLSGELAKTREEVEMLKKSNTSLQISLTSLNRDVASLTAAVMQLGISAPKLPARQVTKTVSSSVADQRGLRKVAVQAPAADPRIRDTAGSRETKTKILQEEIE